MWHQNEQTFVHSGHFGFPQNSVDFIQHFILGKYLLRPNSPGPLMDDWKVTDDSSLKFHDRFIAKNEENTHHGNLWLSHP